MWSHQNQHDIYVTYKECILQESFWKHHKYSGIQVHMNDRHESLIPNIKDSTLQMHPNLATWINGENSVVSWVPVRSWIDEVEQEADKGQREEKNTTDCLTFPSWVGFMK
jgi:predicted RNA-binding protein